MANISNLWRRLFKRRKYQRFAVHSGTFVIVSPAKEEGQGRKVQIVDISLGGAAFIYPGSPSDLEADGFIKMFSKTSDAGKVQFQTVSDIPAPSSEQTEESFRRRGVKFTWMGMVGKAELKDFLKEFGLCPT